MNLLNNTEKNIELRFCISPLKSSKTRSIDFKHAIYIIGLSYVLEKIKITIMNRSMSPVILYP